MARIERQDAYGGYRDLIMRVFVNGFIGGLDIGFRMGGNRTRERIR